MLKGQRTLVVDPQGRAAVNPTGNPGMATGGTGDVLAGIVGALLARHDRLGGGHRGRLPSRAGRRPRRGAAGAGVAPGRRPPRRAPGRAAVAPAPEGGGGHRRTRDPRARRRPRPSPPSWPRDSRAARSCCSPASWERARPPSCAGSRGGWASTPTRWRARPSCSSPATTGGSSSTTRTSTACAATATSGSWGSRSCREQGGVLAVEWAERLRRRALASLRAGAPRARGRGPPAHLDRGRRGETRRVRPPGRLSSWLARVRRSALRPAAAAGQPAERPAHHDRHAARRPPGRLRLHAERRARASTRSPAGARSSSRPTPTGRRRAAASSPC